ncbi:putative nucleotide-diphospho-sugar transferase [Helianthus anomalus]
MINTGFYMIKSNNKTITLFNEWYARRDNSTGMKEQDVLVELMKKGAFKRLGIGVRFLDTVFFSGICEDSRDVRAVVTVHANCCRSIKAKVHDLKRIILDWQRFKASPIDETSEFAWSNHSACTESWKQ